MTESIDSSARIYDPLLAAPLRSLRKAIARTLPKNKNTRILDLCCGTGDQLRYLKKQGYTELNGLDLSPDMLTVARNKSTGITFHEGDAAQTSFEDASFDSVLISLALHEKDQPLREAILKEIIRILKPGGSAIVADFYFDNMTRFGGRLMISAIEAMAGGEHFKNFKEYTRRGGMPNVLPENLFEYKEVDRVVRKGIAVWKLSAGH